MLLNGPWYYGRPRRHARPVTPARSRPPGHARPVTPARSGQLIVLAGLLGSDLDLGLAEQRMARGQRDGARLAGVNPTGTSAGASSGGLAVRGRPPGGRAGERTPPAPAPPYSPNANGLSP